jgi:hypothetical protein
MATELHSAINVDLGWTWRHLAGTLIVVDSNRLQFARNMQGKKDADEANRIWHAVDQSLPAGQSTTLHLNALAMEMFDDLITTAFGTVKAIMIVNKNTTGDGSLLVGGAGTQEWCAPFGMIGDTVRVMPGSPLLLASLRDGWEVEAGCEALKIAAVGGDVTFDIAILGLGEKDEEGDSSSSSGE